MCVVADHVSHQASSLTFSGHGGAMKTVHQLRLPPRNIYHAFPCRTHQIKRCGDKENTTLFYSHHAVPSQAWTKKDQTLLSTHIYDIICCVCWGQPCQSSVTVDLLQLSVTGDTSLIFFCTLCKEVSFQKKNVIFLYVISNCIIILKCLNNTTVGT